MRMSDAIKPVKLMSDYELIKEYRFLDDLIYGLEFYKESDVVRLKQLDLEIAIRKLEIP